MMFSFFRRVSLPGLLMAVLGVLLVVGLMRFPGPGELPGIQASIAERAVDGRPPTVAQAMDFTLWYASLAGLVVVVGLAICGRWWTARHSAVLSGGVVVGKRTVWILVGITFLALIPRGPRLGHSFWNDEEVTMQDYAHGEWREGKDGKWKFRPVTWNDTLFYNRGGSNHPLNSVLTKVTVDFFGWMRGGESLRKGYFSEKSARVIPILAALGTVFLLGYLPARAGWPGAGVAAALALALHPWHVRYSVEIRGYSVMLFLILACIGCLWQAMATGKRRWWAGFAGAEAGFLLAFPGALHVAILVNILAVIMIWRGEGEASARWRVFRGLVAWNFLAAVPVIFLMLPSLPQFAYYLKEGKRMIAFAPGFGWEKDFLSHLLVGLPPRGDSPGESFGLGLAEFGVAGRFLLWLGPGIALIGLGRMMAGKDASFIRFFAGVALLAPLVAYGHHRLADHPTMPWYLLFSVFPLCLGWGAAVSPAFGVDQAEGGRKIRLSGLVAGILLAGFWLPVALAANHRLATVPRQPLRETAAMMAGEVPTYGNGPRDRIMVTFGTSAKRLRTYLPEIRVVETTGEFEALRMEADEAGLPIYAAFCGRNLALSAPDRPDDGNLVRAVEAVDSGFVRLGSLRGMEELFSYHVFRRAPRGAGE